MDPGPQPMVAASLTRHKKSGEPYVRSPEVEAQIQDLLGATPEAQLSRARVSDRKAPQYLRNECLAYLIRDAVVADRADRLNALAGILVKRLIRSVERQLAALGVAEDDLGDLHQEVMRKMMKAIADGPRGEFYQVLFHEALRRQIIKSYDSYRRKTRQTRNETSLDAPVGGTKHNEEDDLSLGEFVEGPDDVGMAVEQRLLITEALSAITNPRHRQAFVLHYYYGWQIESEDPDEKTLSILYDRTPKMIGNWIRTAKRQLAEWRAAKGL